jgi:hypothetical protein
MGNSKQSIKALELIKSKRICYACDSNTTRKNDHGNDRWHPNNDYDNNILCSRCYDHFIYKGYKKWIAEGKPHLTTLPPKRTCYACGSDKTRLNNLGSEIWCVNLDTQQNVLCNNCYDHLIKVPRYKPIRDIKNIYEKVRFKDKRLTLPAGVIKPVIGVCNWCRAVVDIDCIRTEFHHDENKYDKDFPLKNTIEIFSKCHGKETWRLEVIKAFKERRFNHYATIPNFKRRIKRQIRNYYIAIYSIPLLNTQFYLSNIN